MICETCGRSLPPDSENSTCAHCAERENARGADRDECASAVPRSDEHLLMNAEPTVSAPSCGIPWENPEKYGFWKGLFATIFQIMKEPRQFFSRMPTEGGFLNPLFFALVLETIGAVFHSLWSVVLLGPLFSGVAGSSKPSLLIILAIPISAYVMLVARSGILHFSLMLVGGASRDFESTFRTAAYSTAPNITRIVPVVGELAASVWSIYLIYWGIREVHEISAGKALLAISLPILTCCAVTFTGAAFFLFVLR